MLSVSFKIYGFADVVAICGEGFLNELFGDVQGEAQAGYDATLEFDLDAVPTEEYEALSSKLAAIKRHVIGAPIKQALNGLSAGKAGVDGVVRVKYRKDEDLFIKATDDKVSLVYALNFVDVNDLAISRVFLDEFQVARRERSLGGTPVFKFSTGAPPEIGGEKTGPAMGFATLTFEQRHASSPEMIEKGVTLLFNFRNYMHYHIKCSKAYMHTRMRLRVVSLLQILSRAKPSNPDKEKKTASGKTFGKK